MQQRQPWKKIWPDMWDLCVGGAALVGDDSRQAAQREVEEELGLSIDLSNERPRLTFNFEKGFDDYWIVKKDFAKEEFKLQYEEVKDVKWVNREQLKEMISQNIVIPYFFLDKIFELKDSTMGYRI